MALYPPIVASSMPAFDINSGVVRIYYTLSSYNTARKDDIQLIQISLRRQSSNVNVLKNEIMNKTFGIQNDIDKPLNRYYIEIFNTDLKENFEVDAIYKVQLRFCEGNQSTVNINSYSEWSTVCIIKPIQAPQFYINDFYTGVQPKETDHNTYFYSFPDFIGIYKQGESCSEKLKHWRLRLLSKQYTKSDLSSIEDFVLADSGWILNNANNYNLNDSSVVLSCSLPYQMKDQSDYKLYFEIQTKNGYYNNLLYTFTCNIQNMNKITGKLFTYINEEEGYIKLDFKSDENKMCNLLIRRTDSRSNFLKWEDLKYFEILDNLSFTYYDFTVQSGTFYKYLVQKIDARGRRGTPIYSQSKSNIGVMAEWQHAFLLESTGNGSIEGVKQLKLKYDFQISSYKTNVSENKTDTIGSKYPFIRRNGNMYYRTFPISGTITQFMDEASLFTSSQQLFNNKFTQYKNFKGQIEKYCNKYDYTYERKFREKVEQFLYNSKPKLYKSMQEGNIFIKLMDISLTPKNQLSRLVYSFSATAYQIDQAEIKTYNNYGLINIGTFNPNISDKKTHLAQITSYDFNNNIMGNMFKAGQDIIGTGQHPAANSIAKYIKYNQSFNNTIVKDFDITWLRITIESEPYLIIEQNGVYRPFDDVIPQYIQNNSDFLDKKYITKTGVVNLISNEYQDDITSKQINYPLYQIQSTLDNTNIYLGWLFEINNGIENENQIIISPPNNIYELKEDGFYLRKTAKIIPAKDIAMLVDFRIVNSIEEDLNKVPRNIRSYNANGQLIGTYNQQINIISKIKYKYKHSYQEGKYKVKRFVNNIKTVLVDTQPGTVIKLKTTIPGSQEDRFVINETGELNFDPNIPTVGIESLKIIGRNIIVKQSDIISREQPLENLSPKQGDIAILNNIPYYFYKFQWRKAQWVNQENGLLDVYHPVDALIFYFASIKEEMY